nr:MULTISPECIES: hypothetical protein [Flavobacterium]
MGKLISVSKAKISILESNTNSPTIETIFKVFSALKANINFNMTIKKKNL